MNAIDNVLFIVLGAATITFIVCSVVYLREAWREYADRLRDEGAEWMYRRMMNEIRMRNERQSALDAIRQVPGGEEEENEKNG